MASIFGMIIGWTFQIMVMLLQMLLPALGWYLKRPFYLAGGILLFAIATVSHSIDPLLGFLIGTGVAMAAEWFLSNYDLLYRQVVFGVVGISAGILLHIGLATGPLPPMVLTGLCIWHAQQARS